MIEVFYNYIEPPIMVQPQKCFKIQSSKFNENDKQSWEQGRRFEKIFGGHGFASKCKASLPGVFGRSPW